MTLWPKCEINLLKIQRKKKKAARFPFGTQLHSMVSQRWTSNVNYCSPHCAWHRPTWCKPTSRLCIWKEHAFFMMTCRGGLHWYDFPFPQEQEPLKKERTIGLVGLFMTSVASTIYTDEILRSLSFYTAFSKVIFGSDWPIHAMSLKQQHSVQLLWVTLVCGAFIGVLVYFFTQLSPAASTVVAVCWTVP